MSEKLMTDYASLADEIAGWLRFQMEQVGASRLVLGLSGGIDSAVVCALSTMAAGPSRVIAAIMPVHSRPEDTRDAEMVASAFEVDPHVIDLVPAHDALIAAMPGENTAGLEDANVNPARQSTRRQLARANVKPRLRMTTLYYLANRYNGLVVGTGNKTELAIGYFTKYGDGGVDVLPLGDLDKTAVRSLARALRVPEPVINKAPSAGLWEGQTDEAEIGVSYDELDRTLASFAGGENGESAAPDTMDRISNLITASEHKRRPIPVFRRDTVDVVSRQ
jgi:NAD+ synthase